MASSKSSSKKRARSVVFDVVEALETQDAVAERKRRTATTQTRDLQRCKAAQSQAGIYSSLVECRILLQRSILAQQQQQQTTDNSPRPPAVDQCNELLVKLLQARQTLSQKQDGVDYEALVKDEVSLEERLQTEYETYREEWKEVLDRRHKDMRLHSGALTNKTQFRVMDSSFFQQVEAVVKHEQLRQQSYSTTFDDTKVYQQLLKDFMSTSSSQAATGNYVQAAAQQRLLSKKSVNREKSQVDRKASKGRKIRYSEIPKLANFTFPLSRPSSDNTTLDEDAWFRSLFGGVGSVK